jgi:Kef-type K+ transport system membrane component KefB
MDHLTISQLLGMLVAILAGAKVAAAIARRLGQPAVLGELMAGVLLGASCTGLVNPRWKLCT